MICKSTFMINLKRIIFISKIYIIYEDEWGDNFHLWILCQGLGQILKI